MADDVHALAQKAVELHELRRFRNRLLVFLVPAFLIQAWAVMKVITSSVVLVGAAVGACIATFVTVTLVAWAGRTQRKIERLEVEVD